MEKKILYKILNSAIKAPSGNNLQNWKIKLMQKNEGFVLSINPFYKKFFDARGIASYFSCGCFLKNIEITALKYGHGTKIKTYSDGSSLNVAKVIFFMERKGNSGLYSEIEKRFTCRTPYNKKELPAEFYKDVEKLYFKFKGLKIFFIKRGDNIFKKIVDILYKTETVRMFNKSAMVSTSAAVRHSSREVFETKDGLDYRLLGIPIFQKQVAKMIFNWNFLRFLKKMKINLLSYISSKRLLNTSTGIGCVFIKNTSSKSIIEAGMFFQELWLILTKYEGYLQPFATLPFFNLKIEYKDVSGFDNKEINRLRNLKNRLFSILEINKGKKLIMVYRYGVAKKNPKFLSMRKDLKESLVKSNFPE
ncbi:MAG: hypothetical protein ABIF18_03440 [archaeon]